MVLICTSCNRQYDGNSVIWRCECGGLLDLRWTARFPLRKIKSRKPNMWRYIEALPIDDPEDIISFEEGFTPLLEVRMNNRTVWVKQDQLFPTGSFKDRGASVMMSHVLSLGVPHIIEDSSGNAGASVAAYAARAKIRCSVFVPHTASPGKMNQIRNFGAMLNSVRGAREDVAAAALNAAETAYYASHAWNPFFFHGTKTFAYEVCEQFGWRGPDAVVLPVGNGTLLLGAAMGFSDLLEAGLIPSMPRMVAVQTTFCAPVCEALGLTQKDGIRSSRQQASVAEGIAVHAPVRLNQIVKAIRESSGTAIVVTEADIERWVCRSAHAGFCIEPTSAAALAGTEIFLEQVPEDAVVVTAMTGHGLKSSYQCLLQP